MTENQPHAKYPHVFGVLRIDSYEDMELDDRLMLTSVFTTSEAAENDAVRLNALAQQRGSGDRYITLLSRLKERPDGETVSADPPHGCDGMARALEDSRVPLEYFPKYREYGLLVAGGSAVQIIEHCPWCGLSLPPSLRDEFFDRLDAMGLEPGDPEVPADFASDAWWKGREIGAGP